VYPRYIPAGEIWIDDAQHELDRTATALHELVERDLMLSHSLTYDHAHDSANVYERALRKKLVKHRPITFGARAVTAAYRDYLREGPIQKTSRQLDREIAAALGVRV
jgi:hypothetical protein